MSLMGLRRFFNKFGPAVGIASAILMVGGVGFPPFPFPVGKGFDAFFEQVDAAAAGAVDPIEGETHACRDQRQRTEAEIKGVAIHSRIPPPAGGEARRHDKCGATSLPIPCIPAPRSRPLWRNG